jgi:hypothetical protein
VRAFLTASDHFRDYAALQLLLRSLRAPLQPLQVVVDTNFLLRLVRARTRLRQGDARTDFEECADAGIVLAYAPVKATVEVEAHFDEFSDRYDVPRALLETSWSVIRPRLHFINAKPSVSAAQGRLFHRDPTDVPFLDVFEHLQLDAALTDDDDWLVTGHDRFDWRASWKLFRALRDYARAVGPLWTSNSFSLLGVLSIGGLSYAFWKSPIWFKAALTAASAGALIYEPSRTWLKDKSLAVLESVMTNEHVVAGFKRITEGQRDVGQLEENARVLLAGVTKLAPPDVHALRALVTSRTEIDEARVAHVMKLHGWVPTPEDGAQAAAREALSVRPEAVESREGFWCLRQAYRPTDVSEADRPSKNSANTE